MSVGGVVIGNVAAQFLTKFCALPAGGSLWPERQAAAVLGNVAHELIAGTRIAQFLNGHRRHEARPDQAMGAQISKPRHALMSLLRPGTQWMCRFNIHSKSGIDDAARQLPAHPEASLDRCRRSHPLGSCA